MGKNEMSGSGVPQCPAAPAPGVGATSEIMVVEKAMGRQERASGSLIGGFYPAPEGLWGCFLSPLLPTVPWSSPGGICLLHPGIVNQATTLVLQLDLFYMHGVSHISLFSFNQNMYNLVQNTRPVPVLCFRPTAIVFAPAKPSFTWSSGVETEAQTS